MAPNPNPTPTSNSSTPFSNKLSNNSSILTPGNLTNSNSNQRYRYQSEIQAMMYTFGDVRHPLSSTSLLIEDIVHSQIIELVSQNYYNFFKKDFYIHFLFSSW